MRCQSKKTRPQVSYVLTGLTLALAIASTMRNAEGQSPKFEVKQWTMADGLIDSSLEGIARVRDGFLWMSTRKGLIRFDGVQFKAFSSADFPDLDTTRPSDVVSGPDGQVYIGMATGLLILGDHGTKTVETTAKRKSDAVQVVLTVGQDEVWFGTAAGYLYHYRHGTTEAIGPEHFSGETIYGLIQTSDGTLWVGTGNGLYRMTHGQISRYKPTVKLPVDGFFDLAVTESGSIFAATDKGVLQIRGATWRFWTTNDGLPGDHIQVLAAAPDDTLWIGTSLGLGQLVHGKARTIRTYDCSVAGLSVDPDRSLWVGCDNAGGLLHVFQPDIRLHAVSSKLPALQIYSLVEDKRGVVWMATIRGLVRWHNGESRLYNSKDGLVPELLTSVSQGMDGSVWMASDDGFARMQKGKIETFRTQAPGPQDTVYSILEDSQRTLWVGTPKALISRPHGQSHLQAVQGFEARVWSIREDSKGNKWVSTADKGLYQLSASSQTHFTTRNGLASDMVSDTLEDANGDIWVATAKGLSRIRDGKCQSVTQTNGYGIGHIFAFASDLAGRLWLRIEGAALAINISEANHVLDHGGSMTHSRFYGFDDGFRDQLLLVMAGNAVMRHSSGEMWFASASGFASIDPRLVDTPESEIRPVVTAFASDVGDHNLDLPLSVNPGDLRIQLAYTAPTMKGASSLEFRYRLIGFDPSWQKGGKQREAVYTSLPPGSYKFVVSVRRPFESWVDSSSPLQIQILPHFYQTWWWYTLIALAFASMMFFAYQLRVRTLRRQFAILIAERLRERSRLARELHDTLSQGMVGIHLQIEAAQVLLDVDPKSVRRHLENVGRLALEASIETRRSIAELRSGEIVEPPLSEILRKAASDFERTCITPLETTFSEPLPYFTPNVVHEISRILEEALANVRVHSNATQAVLVASGSKTHFLVVVRDNGTGFTAENSKSLSGHFGITGMNERASRINGRLSIVSAPGEGTRVTLEVPLRAKWNGFLMMDYLASRPIFKYLSGREQQ